MSMKTAEEWFNEINEVFSEELDIDECRSYLRSSIQKIQLDAWKQGMNDAASMIKKAECPDYYHDYCGCQLEVSVRISELAKNKTSL